MLKKLKTESDGQSLFFVCAITWLIGTALSFGLYCVMPTDSINKVKANSIKPFSDNQELANGSYYFRVRKIFLHNLFVASMICIGGYVTGGLLSLVMLLYNGFLTTSIIINDFLSHKGIWYLFNHLFLHGIFEITSFIWFGAIGVSGFFAWKSLIYSKPIRSQSQFSLGRLYAPLILLAIAAIVESL